MEKVEKMMLNCPECGSSINVDELMINTFRDSIKKDLTDELKSRESDLKSQQQLFNEMSKQFADDKKHWEQRVKEQVETEMLSKEESLKQRIRKEINDEKALELQELENELIRKSTQLKSMNQTKAQMARLQREMEEQEARIVMEKEEEFNLRLEKARASISLRAERDQFLKMKEKEKLISDLKTKLEEAKRKVDQGSMQMQGEVQELEIKNILQEAYPYDEISQSKKGANGADILQLVKTKKGASIGNIYYESKRTQAYSDKWIPKLKQDNLMVKAEILVLVTQSLPKGIERYGLVDDVWVCDFNSVKELSLVLRYGLLKVYSVIEHQHGAKEKSELLYAYITSNEFKNIFESIIAGFKTIQESHYSEQVKIKRLWVEREKQLSHILSNLVEHYGSLRDIGGDSIGEIKMFEFLKIAV